MKPSEQVRAGNSRSRQAERERRRLHIEGVVQGVGFRPFVYTLATRLGLAGFVGNDSSGVYAEVEGDRSALAAFTQELLDHPPLAAHIDRMMTTALPPTGEASFAIAPSASVAGASTLISPDLALCDDCLRELFDPNDRRYRYPFINCTNCGPRFTITRALPYDRPLTTMAAFPLCPACRREYEDPLNRRFHAQPNACPDCGPHVEFVITPQRANGATPRRGEEAISATQQLLAAGGIVAVKGIGGFHLACDATNAAAVQMLRARKQRSAKPLAVMARDVETARQIAHINDAELALLTGRERPIVLLRKRDHSPLAAAIAPGNTHVGVMLPYTPLHHLLLAPDEQRLLVMTSGNLADEPIVKENDEALIRLAPLADAFLLHNRAIHVHCDDAVMRVVDNQAVPIRRSRGYAPFPVALPVALQPTLAVGGELKSTFCLAKGDHAFMSQHIGDMQNLETLQAFEGALAHMQTVFRIEPAIIACDQHPGYLSTRWATEHAGDRPLVKVQHHHAHLAALMAEHGLRGDAPVIGFSFDGTGYGSDGAIWGGEVLIADYRGYQRVTHLRYFPLPGGDAAIRRPYRAALAALWAAGIPWADDLPPVAACPPAERAVIRRQLDTGLNAPPTSSMGRLFDVVAALAGIRQTIDYEAQAAIELEAYAVDSEERYHFELPTAADSCFDATSLLQTIVDDVRAGVAPARIASRFHSAVADLIVRLSLQVRAQRGLHQVALSGGLFQNAKLVQQVAPRLRVAGFTVLTHQRVPPNDGGLALGQAVVANYAVSEE